MDEGGDERGTALKKIVYRKGKLSAKVGRKTSGPDARGSRVVEVEDGILDPYLFRYGFFMT